MTYARLDDSVYKYGNTSRLYGAPVAAETVYYWAIEFDWDNDGAFNGDNEAKYAIGLDSDRGFGSLYDSGEDGSDEFGPAPMVGNCTITLSNHTGRFSPWSTEVGALGYNIAPGRMMRVRARRGGTGTIYPIFAGFIKSVSENKQERTVTISCVDGVEFLQEHDCSVAFNSDTSNPTSASEARLLILNSVSYPYSFSESDMAFDFPYYYASGSALKEYNRIGKAINDMTCVLANGDLKSFLPWIENSLDIGTTYGASTFQKDIDVSMPYENIKTLIRRYKNTIHAGAAGSELWNNGAANFSVAGSSSETIWVDYSAENIVVAVPTAPVSGTDFVANTAYDGSGSNITANQTITMTDFGTRAKLVIANADASRAYFTTLKLRGTPYTKKRMAKEITGTDYMGVGEKILTTDGRLMWKVGSKFVIDELDDMYKYLGYPQSTKKVVVRIDTQEPQIMHDIGDVITFTITEPDLSIHEWATGGVNYNVYNILRIKHKWLTPNGQSMKTEWTLQHKMEAYAPTAL